MNVALLGLRPVVGLTFSAHGAQKLFGAFGGPGIEGTAGFFDQIGLRPGKLHGWVAALTEFFGGLAIGVGILGGIGAVVSGRLITAREARRPGHPTPA